MCDRDDAPVWASWAGGLGLGAGGWWLQGKVCVRGGFDPKVVLLATRNG